jgi:copper transport protein
VKTRAWIGAAVAATVVALALPAAASAHAYLIKTVPAASVILSAPPPDVALTYDEAVEPRFAIISITDAAGQQEATASPQRSPSNPDTLVVPLKPRLPEGWYLVYWRAISVDGHPVQGAFTFAVGPNPGPQPQFKVPSIAQTATTTPLLIGRWAMFLTVMTAIGLFALRMLIARPLVRRVEGTSLRPLSVAFLAVGILALVAIPLYLEEATAVDSLRSFFSFGNLVPLFSVTAFGRGYLKMELCLALFVVAAAIALWTDRPNQPARTIAALLSLTGALAAAASVLALPGASGHAGQTAPVGVSLLLDWLHLLSGSVWLGGLIGLLILWWKLPAGRRVAGLAVVVPRFSNVAFVSVLVLLGTGVGASIIHLPVLAALWQTSYGEAILIKAGILTAALAIAAVNLLYVKPVLAATRSEAQKSAPAARLLGGTVTGEATLITGAIFVAAVLSSLAPPPPSFALEGSALARVGPGSVAATVNDAGYTLRLLVTPNRAAAPDAFALKLTHNGQPVRNANVTLTFNMLDMQMPTQEYQLAETRPGIYSRAAPALVMVGHWGLSYTVTPAGGRPFTAFIVDHANG